MMMSNFPGSRQVEVGESGQQTDLKDDLDRREALVDSPTLLQRPPTELLSSAPDPPSLKPQTWRLDPLNIRRLNLQPTNIRGGKNF